MLFLVLKSVSIGCWLIVGKSKQPLTENVTHSCTVYIAWYCPYGFMDVISCLVQTDI